MITHRDSTRRPRISSNDSHSSDESYAYKATKASSKGRPSSPRAEKMSLERAKKQGNEDWLSPENVLPVMRELAWDAFKLNPWCPHRRSNYLKWYEANNKKPQPCAIEVFAQSSHERQVRSASSPTASSHQIEIPRAIRINSKPILDFLSSFIDEGPQKINPPNSTVMDYPYKVLIQHDSAIRNRCDELQQSFDFIRSKQDQPEKFAASEFATKESSETRSFDRDPDEFLKDITQTSVELRHFRCMVDFMDKWIKPHVETFRRQLPGKVRFQDLWLLFQPGDYVLWNIYPHASRNRLHSLEKRKEKAQLWRVSFAFHEHGFRVHQDRHPFHITAFRIDFDGTSFGPVSRNFLIAPFEGEQDVTCLELAPLRYFEDSRDLLEKCLANGQKFLEYVRSGPSFRMYEGHSSFAYLNGEPCPDSMANESKINSQVMVDFKEALHEEVVVGHSLPDLSVSGCETPSELYEAVGSYCVKCDHFQDDRAIDKAMGEQFQKSDPFLNRYAESILHASDYEDFLGDWELRLLPECVPAWNFSSGNWNLLEIQGLRPVEVDGALWSELRLRKGQKEAILSLAQSHFQKTKNTDTTDYTTTERGGTQILLFGPHGVGKTFAAQALSVVICKPLYRIMADYFGRDEETIGERLQQVLSRAERWDCVLLFEDINDLLLRLDAVKEVHLFYYALGRYKGLLLLTAYGPNDIDCHVASHMQLELELPFASKDQFLDLWEAKIDKWRNVCGKDLYIDAAQMRHLAHQLWDLDDSHWTGRYMENMFSAAIALAEHEARVENQQFPKLSTEQFQTIIRATFKQRERAQRPLLPPLSAPPTETSSEPTSPCSDKFRETPSMSTTGHEGYFHLPNSSSGSEYRKSLDPRAEAINATAKILCRDESLHRLFSKLLGHNVLARGFLSDLGTLLELLERHLISEFAPSEGPGENVLTEDARMLAWAIGDRIASLRVPSTKVEMDAAVMQEGSFTAFFESDAFALFKEELAEVVQRKARNPRWEAQTSDFLFRGITLEENPGVDRPLMNTLGIFRRPLHRMGLLEKPVAAGKRRIRWRCRCGEMIYDDFSDDLLPKAMQNLLLHTRRMTSRGSGNSPSNERGLFKRLLTATLGCFGTRSASGSTPTLPFSNDPRAASQRSPGETEAEEDQIHLLICMEDAKYSSGLLQEAIQDVSCDKELFERLGKTYKQQCRERRSFLSLRAVESIEFATFHLIFGDFADVRRHERHCTEQKCHCLPPEEKVWPKPAAEYRCEPVPPEKSPPIGSNMLMHFMQSPDCVADKQQWILKQFPKKLRGKLSARLDGPVKGWGIYLKEGRDKRKVLFLISLNLAMMLVFGIVWSEVKQDIQGGFGIAACWIAVLGLSLAYMDMSGV